MTRSDFRIGWRLLLKEPGYSAAVVCGLAIGFAVCFLLLGFVRYSIAYNAHLRDSDRIYVVKERRNMLPRPDWRASGPVALRDVALNSGPGIEATAAKEYELAVRIGERVAPLRLRVADPNYLRFFGVRALLGDADGALARPDSLVLSRTLAERLFGKADAVGMVAHIDGQPFVVGAILPNLPGNTTPGFDALVGTGVHSWDAPKPDAPPDAAWRSAWGVYIKMPAGADPAGMGALLQDAVTRNRDSRYMTAAWRERSPNGRLTDIALTRLSEMYFDEDLLRSRSGRNYGNKAAVAGLAALALLILVLAATNYINLAAVRTVRRQREIALRKAMGAGAMRMAALFVGESMLVVLLATALGAVLVWGGAPLFAELVDRPLRGMFTPALAASALLAALAVGLLSALYPAWLALRLPAGTTLHGRGDGESASGLCLRRALSVSQFSAAIGLIAVALAVTWQTHYASRADPGFDAAPLLVLSMPNDVAAAPAQAFRDALARVPGVEGVAAVSEAIGRDAFTSVAMVDRPDGTKLPLEMKQVSAGFFDVIGVRPEHGRLFDPRQDRDRNAGVILNALAARALGFATPEAAVGQMLDGRRILGIAPDLRYRSLRQSPEGLMYVLDAAQPVINVRVAAGTPPASLRPQIDALWRQHFPNALLEVDAAASIFAQNYSEDLRLAKILACAGVVATGLASFGIYVLAAYSVRRRSREYVLRKLHGARAADIAGLVLREFSTLIGIGAALGLPLAWLATQRYLAPYVERAPMGQWPLALALVLVALVALAATSRHTLAAMRSAPAAALRG